MAETKKVRQDLYQEIIVPNMELIKAYIRDGLSQNDVAKKLGITPSTIGKYKKRYPEFDQMWAETREKTDIVNVVGAYYKQAIGYTVVEKEEKYKYIDGVKTLVAENYREKYIPPVEKATSNWIALRLKNNPVWGDLSQLLFKQAMGENTREDAGVILMPPKVKASEEKIIEVQVKEVVDGEDTLETPREAS